MIGEKQSFSPFFLGEKIDMRKDLNPKVASTFICPKCGKEQEILGVQYKSTEWCKGIFTLEGGTIEIIDTYDWDSEVENLDCYFCWDCGEKLTEQEIKEGVKKWLEKRLVSQILKCNYEVEDEEVGCIGECETCIHWTSGMLSGESIKGLCEEHPDLVC